MKVPYREDLASHSGPEPHGGCGNTMADAWVGGSVGGALSSEITSFGCRPCCLKGKAISTIALFASYGRTWRSLSTLACVDTSCAGIGRSGKNPPFYSWNGRIQQRKISCGIGGGSAPMEMMSRKTECKWRVGGRRRNAVRPAHDASRKSDTTYYRRSRRTRGHVDLSGVCGGKYVTKRNSRVQEDCHSPYAVTDSCVVSISLECAGEHMLIM
jgi:hypothetical protein